VFSVKTILSLLAIIMKIKESSCLGVQLKVGGKFHLKPLKIRGLPDHPAELSSPQGDSGIVTLTSAQLEIIDADSVETSKQNDSITMPPPKKRSNSISSEASFSSQRSTTSTTSRTSTKSKRAKQPKKLAIIQR